MPKNIFNNMFMGALLKRMENLKDSPFDLVVNASNDFQGNITLSSTYAEMYRHISSLNETICVKLPETIGCIILFYAGLDANDRIVFKGEYTDENLDVICILKVDNNNVVTIIYKPITIS